jgi:hypothetical protein
MNKREVLAATTFGQRVAEQEADALISYFVETHQWKKLLSGEVDVIYGPKGSGKSALYALLRERWKELLERHILPIPGEEIQKAPVFADLVTDPPASEEQFRGLWKLYFLSLLATGFRLVALDNDHVRSVNAALESAGLLSAEWSLKRALRAALDYVRRIESVGAEVKVDPVTGQPVGVGGKITLREPGNEQRRQGYVSADSLMEEADKALGEGKLNIWIVLDRLDVAFAESPALERNALRALFRVYSDFAGLDNISVKIFLRDDIWTRIMSSGFREASHITKSITITWDSQSLLHLVIRRALHNDALREFYRVDPGTVLASAEEQYRLFYRIFPAQVDSGEKKPTTLDWLVTRTADGTGKTAPRELIHLLSAARDEQLRLLEMGGDDPPGEALLDRNALKAALPEVSKVRYEQTLCAEYANLKPILAKLEGEKTQQTPATLATIWHVSEADALAKAEALVETGFFQKRGSKEQPLFWVPFLYRDALHLVQGQAEQ